MIHLITKELGDESGRLQEYLQPAPSYDPLIHGRFLLQVVARGDVPQEIIIDESIPIAVKARPPESKIIEYSTPANINLGEN